MKQSEADVSKALRDVWAWKDAIYREVEGMPADRAISTILDRAEKVTPNQSTKPVPAIPAKPTQNR